MNTHRNQNVHAALMSLEAAGGSARGGFACMFSNSDEYETALITERRAQGRYGRAAAALADGHVRRLRAAGRRRGAAVELSCCAVRRHAGRREAPFFFRLQVAAGLETCILNKRQPIP